MVAAGALCSRKLPRASEQSSSAHHSRRAHTAQRKSMQKYKNWARTAAAETMSGRTEKMRKWTQLDVQRRWEEKGELFFGQTELPEISTLSYWSPFNHFSPTSCWSVEQSFGFLGVFLFFFFNFCLDIQYFNRCLKMLLVSLSIWASDSKSTC